MRFLSFNFKGFNKSFPPTLFWSLLNNLPCYKQYQLPFYNQKPRHDDIETKEAALNLTTGLHHSLSSEAQQHQLHEMRDV